MLGLGSGVIAVAAGGYHACALTQAGSVVCWGSNYEGELGDGTKKERHRPVVVKGLGTGVTAIAAGDGHSCAVTKFGKVKCWGENQWGQLGDGTTTDRSTPVVAQGLTGNISVVEAGNIDTCALTATHAARCWGNNKNGQLGDGTRGNIRVTPVAVRGLHQQVFAIAPAYSHTCVVTVAGGAMCWGYGRSGSLGGGNWESSLSPVSVAGLASGVSAISSGYGHTCALLTEGGARCWGYNLYGQLGDGTINNAAAPVDVVGF